MARVSEPWCQISDLPEIMCADCVHRTHGRLSVPTEDLIGGPGTAQSTDSLVRKGTVTTQAKFASTCRNCGEPYPKGTLIYLCEGDIWACGCVSDG